MCSERVITTCSASCSAATRAARSRPSRSSGMPARPRLGERCDHVRRLPLVEMASSASSSASVRDHLAGEDGLGPDVVGDRGEDRRILREVERARAARQRGSGGRWRSATTSMASVAEPPLPSASSAPPLSSRSRSASAAATSVVAVVRERLRAQLADIGRLREHGAAHVGHHGLEVVLALDEEGVEEARRAGVVVAARCGPRAGRGGRRTRARAPRDVVKRLDQLLARRRVGGGGRNSHSAPAGANASVRQPRSRAIGKRRVPRPLPAAASGGVLVGSEADRDVVGLREQRELVRKAPPSPARPIAGSARLPTMTG